MKKLLILALASAFVAAANADVVVSSWGATSSGPSSATWTNAPSEEGGVLKVDADVGDMAVLTPSGTAPAPQVKTVVTVEATFTAISDSPLEDLTEAEAKTALTVQNVNNTPRYRYWDGDSWEALKDSVVAVTNAPVEITIELDNDTVGKTTVAFKVVKKSDSATVLDESVDLTTGGTETYLLRLAFAGTGDLTSVAATVTPAYATYNNTRYETTAAAVTAKGANSGDITLYDHGAGVQLPSDPNKYYYSKASGNNTILGVFPASGSGTAQDPYTIGNLEDLTAFRQYVAAGFTTQGKTFAQTDDIALDAAWPGIGIQNGKDLVGYATTGKDAITPEEASQRDASWNAGAFKGTYDGGNHTISSFQMVGVAGNPANNNEGLDYCGFFNSVDGATIKNLNIQYAGALFAVDTTASTKESGATFVGVAKNSTLQNLTSLQKDANTAVSCSKGFGGIVGYTTSGTTVDSCTNNVNMTSLANNKCGGIAMITQKGSAVTIRNCQNNGTTAGNANQKGGIVGYVGVATTIADCEDTAGSDPSFLHHETGTLTMTGVNKAPAGVKSYTKNTTNISGLNFATVDGNVATFVADNALEAEKTYKVMATGATATANLAAKGDYISFDTALVATEDTKPTFNITAGSRLVAKPSTEGSVTTYTADDGYEVVSTATTTLVAVPAACTADTLIDTSNRAEGDVLKAYNTTDGFYYTWRLSSKKAWETAVTYKVSETDSAQHSTDASSFELKAGQAVWLTRQDTNKEIILAVVAGDGPMEVAVDNGYNLIAPPPAATAYDAKTSLKVADEEGSFDEGDQIVVPTTAAPQSYTRKDGKWKVLSGDATTPTNMPEGWGAVADPTWTEPSKIEIPSGQGFWFNSKKAKKLEF